MNELDLIGQAMHELLLMRCDRCPGTVKATAQLRAGILQFCNHHTTELGPALRSVGAQLIYTEATAGKELAL